MDFTPYELRHLAVHLVAAERFTDLHRLLSWSTTESAKNMWFEACAEAGNVAGYLGDVRRGWDAAVAGRGADAVDCLALQARYALMSATMGSLASAVPPSLIVELVRTGVWTVEQAVGAARRVPDFEQRVESLMGVSALRGLPHEEIERLWQEALAAAEAVPDDYRRAGVLARLSVTLPAHLQARIYGSPFPSPEELEIRYATGDASAEVDLTSDALAEARLVSDLIEQLTSAAPDGLDHAWHVALTLKGELQRTLAFAQVVPRLVEAGRLGDAEVAVAGLTATDRVSQGRLRVRAGCAAGGAAAADLAPDAPLWRSELLTAEVAGAADPAAAAREALVVSTHVGDGELVDELVAAGAMLLAEGGFVEEALSEVTTLRSAPRLAKVLRVMAPDVSGAEASAVEALTARLDDALEWAIVLLSLSPTSEEASKRRRLVSDRRSKIRDPAMRAELATMLAAGSAEPQRGELIREAVSWLPRVMEPNARARTMGRMLRHTPEAVSLLDLHLVGVHSSHEALAREAFATALVRQGRPKEVEPLLSGIVDRPWRDCAIYSVAVRLASTGHVEHAVDLAALLSEPFLTPELVRILSRAGRDVPAGVWTVVDAITDPVRRAMALIAVLEVDPPGPSRPRRLNEVKAALAVADDGRVAVPLLAAARLGIPIEELRQCVDSLGEESVRAVGIAGLALYCGADDPLRSLASLPPVDRLSAELHLAEGLQGAPLLLVLDDAARLVSAASDDRRLRQRLVATMRRGLELPDATLTRLWSGSLEIAGQQERSDALETVRSLHPLGLLIGGGALVGAVGAATRQVALWWP